MLTFFNKTYFLFKKPKENFCLFINTKKRAKLLIKALQVAVFSVKLRCLKYYNNEKYLIVKIQTYLNISSTETIISLTNNDKK